jgi:maltoporin
MKYNCHTRLALAISTILVSASVCAVDFHGYARAGSSTTSNGGEQYCFNDKLDGAHYAGRLGDECDTYGEVGLGQGFKGSDESNFYIDTMFSYQAKYQGNDYQSIVTPSQKESRGDWALRQLNVQAKNVLAYAPESTVWIGKRYYQRRDVHILDLYYLNNSGYGAGIENVTAGPGKVSIAWLTGDRVPSKGKYDANGEITVQTEKYDLRYQDLDIWQDAKLNFAMIYGKADLTDVQDKAKEPDNDGIMYSSELIHKIGSAENTFVLQYGKDGLADSVLNSSSGTAVETYTDWQGDTDNAYRVIYFGSSPLASNVDIAYSALYAEGETVASAAANDSPSRMSFVMRPSYYWNKLHRTTVELGISENQLSNQTESQKLEKIILAHEITPDIGLMTRPVLRFYTGAFFDNAAENITSSKTTGEDGNIRLGAQLEAWW